MAFSFSPLRCQQLAQVHEVVDIGRVKTGRFFEVGNRAVDVVAVAAEEGAVVVDTGVVGRQPNGLVELLGGVREIVRGFEIPAAGDAEGRLLRVKADGLVEVRAAGGEGPQEIGAGMQARRGPWGCPGACR